MIVAAAREEKMAVRDFTGKMHKKRLASELYDKIFQSLFTDGIISDIIKFTTNCGKYDYINISKS